MQKLTKFKVIFDLFTVCVYFIQQQNCKLYYIYLMIISEIQSEIGHCSCDSAKFKAPADFRHHAILCMTLSLITMWFEIDMYRNTFSLYRVDSETFVSFRICLGNVIQSDVALQKPVHLNGTLCTSVPYTSHLYEVKKQIHTKLLLFPLLLLTSIFKWCCCFQRNYELRVYSRCSVCLLFFGIQIDSVYIAVV